MRNPHGYALWTGPEGPPIESDTITCCHCNRIVILNIQAQELGGFCTRCMDHICGPCADRGLCEPFERKLEEMERAITKQLERQRFFTAVGV